jgi:phage FluMu protein Com
MSVPIIGKKQKEEKLILHCIKCGRPLMHDNDRMWFSKKCPSCKTVNRFIIGVDGKLYQFAEPPELRRVN